MLKNESLHAGLLKNRIIIKRVFLVSLLLLFLGFSLAFINPTINRAHSDYHSSQLEKIVIRDGNQERTDYVDNSGRITTAANLGYATMIITETEQGKLERYYDDLGKPINRYSGYYGVLREYDENGHIIRNIYLDIEEHPMVMLSGYAIEEREYNENGKMVVARYYDAEGKPILTSSYGYGKILNYDTNGSHIKTTYIDTDGNPIMTGLGYAIITFHRYTSEGPKKGKVESEFYFDTEGNPVSLSLGQYGVHKEYDEVGRESVCIYLDAGGKPIVTNKGYTTVTRSFQADNSIAVERYFDLEGNPFALAEGQYGVDRENGRTVYLDEKGLVKFNIRTLLYNESRLVIIFALVIVALAVFLNRKWSFFLLVFFLAVIAYLTLMFREKEAGKQNLQLFWSYSKIFSDSEIRADILKNIWLFIPLGAVLYRLYPRKIILLVPFGISVFIEAMQYLTGSGLCELDDVISNGLGGCIGYLIEQMFTSFKENIQQRKQYTV